MSAFSYELVTNDGALKEAFQVRKQVFVVEQEISEAIEFDGYDGEALHVVAKDGEKVIGTARVMFPAADQAKIERMAVLIPYRRKGVGSRIISFLDDELKKRHINQVVLHAQYAVVDFYASCGFEGYGPLFMEAGIEHVKMQRKY